MLEIRDVTFSYHAKREILKGVTLSAGSGEIVCLLGSNGVGKTTLLRCLLGFQKATSGTIRMDGLDVASLSPKQRAHYLAYVPQSSNLAFPYEAKEVVLMGRVSRLRAGAAPSALDKQAALAAMERLQVGHLADRRYQELSGGEKQMVLVARALAQDAQLLVMDEPTANLDYHNQVKILSAIKHLASQGLSILMTSHYPDHAFLACTKVALMNDGRIVRAGSPDEVVTSENLTALYDTPVRVMYAQDGALRIKTCIPLLDASQFAEGSAQQSHVSREQGKGIL